MVRIELSKTYNDLYGELQVVLDGDYTIDLNVSFDGDELMEIVTNLQKDLDTIKAFAKMAQANAY